MVARPTTRVLRVFESPLESLSYHVVVSTTLTVRTDEALREALRVRAAAQGKTVSQLVQEILEDAVRERPASVRSSHLRGRLDLREEPEDDPWREQLRERNWRP
jgi:plasmid stability protein